MKYHDLCLEVTNLIATAKARYYQNRTSGLQKTDPSKWYREINALTGNSGGSAPCQAPSAEDLSTLTERLQEVFTSAWSNLTSTVSKWTARYPFPTC